jgi:hypothetical protein
VDTIAIVARTLDAARVAQNLAVRVSEGAAGILLAYWSFNRRDV